MKHHGAKFPTKEGGNKVAPKTASPGAGHSDGGAAKDICDVARGLNTGNKKGGAPGL